ncbi:hypothetical protein DPMN_098504 [Dreissena polymorpha]|uniref:EGF-like domain-containing protein n=1 Tax=Dreissena polymorpha TaxID=45954 RepID=A0A9D4R5Q1_DREPO|nr:hypothetical protein DPMN_098504 [Dreissena polymorpha]
MGWQGKVCELDVDECSQNASLCMQGSTCSNIKGSYICHCSRGFEGLNCEIDENECLSAPCLNNGACNNTIGSFNCACAQNYTGTYCEKELSTSTDLFSGSNNMET